MCGTDVIFSCHRCLLRVNGDITVGVSFPVCDGFLSFGAHHVEQVKIKYLEQM